MDGETQTGTPDEMKDARLAKIYCDGYVFYMADGSRFNRTDVERVDPSITPKGLASRLHPYVTEICRKRKHASTLEESDESAACKVDYDYYEDLLFHSCDGTDPSPANFVVANECGDSWKRLTDTQRDMLRRIQERVDADREEKRYFTCAIMEGPGGCGKTRLMSYVMNHAPTTTLVLYATKQNKRVQDFIHTDCLGGESDPTITKPFDLSPLKPDYVSSLVLYNKSVGRYALTAEKLAYAIAHLRSNQFHVHTTVSELGLGHVLPRQTTASTAVEPDRTTYQRNIVLMVDEYTMLQPPIVHALVYTLRRECRDSHLLLLMGGDKLQCGPVNWNDAANPALSPPAEPERYTADIRHEIRGKMDYDPLELTMENLQRCRGDRALGACIKRLRRACEESTSSGYANRKVNTILAKYSAESGVKLYRREENRIGRIVAADPGALESVGTDAPSYAENTSFDEYMNELAAEDLDERGVEFRYAPEPAADAEPAYDITPLVDHFVRLYARLAEISFLLDKKTGETWPTIVYESVAEIRHMFPVFIVLTNKLCNKFAETFLLALSTKVKERVLETPVPASLVGKIPLEATWVGHLKYTLRRCMRSLQIDEDDSLKRQTLFVGMVYKMTSTFNRNPLCYLCNGETVVLTSLVFDNSGLMSVNAVQLRKLDRDSDAELVLETGKNQNRMTEEEKRCIMPFVPYLSENIYQMQGNTMPRDAKTFVDLVNAPCRSVYVAVSRFQNSAAIEGIVIST